jgi:DNA-binding transcriptional MerR regulator
MLDMDDAREAAQALRLEGMPEHEIRAVLDSRDPRFVHRFIELHTERLEERLTARRRALHRLEQILIESVAGR